MVSPVGFPLCDNYTPPVPSEVPQSPKPPQPPEPDYQSSAEEADLLARLRANDDAAFDQLVTRSGPLLLALCRKMLGNEEDAQDAVQETFLKAIAGLKQFDGRSQIQTWLHRIAVNNCLMRLRTRKLKGMKSIDALLPQFVEDGHQRNPGKAWRRSEDEGIQSKEQDKELLALVRAKIEELPDDYRTIIILRDVLDYSTQEVGNILNLGESGVKTRLHRGRQALKELIAPWYDRDRS